MRLRMIRRGTFQCHWSTTKNMCGVTSTNMPKYSYICEIECGPVLDSQGFMIDQLDVDQYFQKRWWNNHAGYEALSCEQMALACVRDVKYLVEAHMMMSRGFSEIHRIAVTISFNETAAMTAEWRSENVCNHTSGTKNRKAVKRQRRDGKTDHVLPSASGRLSSDDADKLDGSEGTAPVFERRPNRPTGYGYGDDGNYY